MANTNVVTDYEDPFQLADLAKREGPEGLLRLADYFETTGQQTPLTVKTALAMSRGPGVFPIKGVLTSDPTPRLPRAVPGEMDYFEAHPNAEMRASGELYDRKTGQLLAKNISDAMLQDRYPPEAIRQTDILDYDPPVTRPTNTQGPAAPIARPAKKDEYDLTAQEVQDEASAFGITPEQMRSWLAQERNRKQQNARPAPSAARPALTRRPAASSVAQGPVPSYTLEDAPSGPIPSFTLEDVAQGPTPEAIAKIARRNVSLASPIPTASAPPTRDAIAPVVSTQPPVTSTSPAGKPESMGTPGLPAPSSEGAGGDADEERNLYLARLIARNAASFGAMGAGKSIDTGAVEALGERLKQVQALRAKREEQKIVDAQAQANNRAQVEYLMQRFPERREALAGLRDMTKSPNFSQMLRVEEQVALDQARAAKEQAAPGFKEREVTVKETEGGSKDWKRQQDIALGWARLNAQAAQAAQKATQDLANAGASRAEQKDIDGQLENIQKIVKGGSYTPLIASLEQADKAITDLGAPPSAAAQVKHALPGGDRLLSPQEKAYYTAVDKLRQMDQLAVSGKVVSEPERAEFLRQYGANWYASPKAAAAYIEMLRAKTANQLNSDLASVRASPSGQKALAAYERQPGAVTPMHPVFKGILKGPSVEPSPISGAPVERVIMLDKEGKRKAVRADQVEKAKAQGWRMP